MINRRTHPIPGAVLIAVPATTWVTLIVVAWVLAATDQDAPFGGFWSIGIAIVVTTTLTSLGIWAAGVARAHVSTEMATVRGMLVQRLEDRDTEFLPRLRVVATASAMVERPALDPKVVELNDHLRRKLTDS